MATGRTQDEREVIVTSPLGKDVLLFKRAVIRERLSQLFEIDLTVFSEDPEIALADIVGQNVTLEVMLPAGGSRLFNGIVSRFRIIESDGLVATYQAKLVPWFWLLTRTADCRIFQEMTVPDIIELLLRELGFTDFENTLTGIYRQWVYCVQYRETAFQFISRLMEQEGIYYFFKHEDGRHVMVLADAITAHAPTPTYETITYRNAPINEGYEYIHGWALEQSVRTGMYSMTDYDFEAPSKNLFATHQIPRQYMYSDFEYFDYPGEYVMPPDGMNYASIRLEECHALETVASARTDSRGIATGSLFTLDAHPRTDQNIEYLIVDSKITINSDEYSTTGSDAPDDEPRFDCRFKAIDSKVPFRPARITPKAVVQGPQTAVVVGPAAEEIWTDLYGRVKVQFFWDRLGMKNEQSSCWIRVSQYWAGKLWGSIHIPRIGQEVIVDFLEGDPDQPIITGRVYNFDQMPPYALPANQSQSGVKSRSTKDGDEQTFNELRFEDLKDAEQVYFHAERDYLRIVENNDTHMVGFEKAEAGDQNIQIHNNQSLIVGNAQAADGSQDISIWNNRTEFVHMGNETVTIETGNRTVTVQTGDDLHHVQTGNRTVLVDTGDDLHQVATGDRTTIVNTGNDTHNILTGNRDVLISLGNDTLTLGAGNQTVTLAAGSSTTTAAMAIELIVGASSIKLDPISIKLSAPMVTIEGTIMCEIKAPLLFVKADAILQMSGGIVLIN